jgi:hypothetical protein
VAIERELDMHKAVDPRHCTQQGTTNILEGFHLVSTMSRVHRSINGPSSRGAGLSSSCFKEGN